MITAADAPEEPTPKPGRSTEYPFSPWQIHLEKAVRKLRGRPRHCAVNAFRGLRRSWAIAELDPEMAFFRAITAEEESATALMFALKQRHYPGAERLRPRDHSHKAGLTPFLATVETLFVETPFPTPTIQLEYEGRTPRVDVHIPSEAMGLPKGYHATPDEPLNGFLRAGVIGTSGEVATFEAQLREYASERGARDILAVIEKEANTRNRLLYAADDGIPIVRDVGPALIARGRPVTLLLTLTVAILQTKKHQLFAVQALQAYLRALQNLPAEAYDYDAALGPPPDVWLSVDCQPDAGPRTRVAHRNGEALREIDMNFELRRPEDDESRLP